MSIDLASALAGAALGVSTVLPSSPRGTVAGLAAVAAARIGADQLQPDRNFYPISVTTSGSETKKRLNNAAWSGASTALLTWPLTIAVRRLPVPRAVGAIALGAGYAAFDSAMRDRISRLRQQSPEHANDAAG